MQYTFICNEATAVATALSGTNERLQREMIQCLDKHYGPVIKGRILKWYGTARQTQNEINDAADAFQEALTCLVYQGRNGHLRTDNGKPALIWNYLFTITRNKFLNAREKAFRYGRILEKVTTEETVQADTEFIEQREQEQVGNKKFTQCFEQLRPNCRELLQEVYGIGKKIKDVAEERKQTVEYLYVELARCRSALKNCLSNHSFTAN